MSEFTGRKVLITGAAGVFGHWILEAFLKAGADIICSDIRVDALRQQVASLGSASGNMTTYGGHRPSSFHSTIKLQGISTATW